MAIALDLDHPVYDCFYLALAEIEQNAMVTADQRLLTRLSGSKLAALAEPL
jgi:predicted nucleic acid-binding protein